VALWHWFVELRPILQALLAGGFTWLLTALGALTVLTMRRMSRPLLDSMLGFAAGVMIAASVWSLLIPSLDLAQQQGVIPWLPAVVGLLLGGIVMRLIDLVLPHLHRGLPRDEAEGVDTTWRRTTLLILAITLHNIPEGLAVGVAFGAAAGLGGMEANPARLVSAVTLAIGVGLQGVPEGMAVAMPLRGEGMSRLKSFWYGQLSAAVEPVAAVIGVAATLLINPILPYALAFAAGAMLFVVIEELPHTRSRGEHGAPLGVSNDPKRCLRTVCAGRAWRSR